MVIFYNLDVCDSPVTAGVSLFFLGTGDHGNGNYCIAGHSSTIQECQSSGMNVTAWCKEKGISQHTYYARLNVVRKELLKRAELPLQQIVPLSVSQSVTCTTATLKTQCIASGTEPEKAEPAFAQKVIVRKDGIEVEMPPDIFEELLLTLLRGLKEC